MKNPLAKFRRSPGAAEAKATPPPLSAHARQTTPCEQCGAKGITVLVIAGCVSNPTFRKVLCPKCAVERLHRV